MDLFKIGDFFVNFSVSFYITTFIIKDIRESINKREYYFAIASGVCIVLALTGLFMQSFK